eukprot:SM000195S05278  [mRNA]  locus=s195:125592:128755:+ [translate_table: standard]
MDHPGMSRRTEPLEKPVPFRMPTVDNSLPVRVDAEFDGRRFRDAFTWNPSGKHPHPDSDILPFARRVVRDQSLPNSFVAPVAQAIQTRLADFTSYRDQQLSTQEKLQTLKLEVRVNNLVYRDQILWDVANHSNDVDAFARNLCADLQVTDAELALLGLSDKWLDLYCTERQHADLRGGFVMQPAIAVAIREQLYEYAKQSIVGRDSRVGNKSRRERRGSGSPWLLQSKAKSTTAHALIRQHGVVRKRSEWAAYKPALEVLTEEEAEAFRAKELHKSKMKRLQEDAIDR